MKFEKNTFPAIYLLKSEPKKGIQVSSLTEYEFDGLEFLEFQNKSNNYLNIFYYQIYALSVKNENYFIMTHVLSLHCLCLVTFN